MGGPVRNRRHEGTRDRGFESVWLDRTSRCAFDDVPPGEYTCRRRAAGHAPPTEATLSTPSPTYVEIGARSTQIP